MPDLEYTQSGLLILESRLVLLGFVLEQLSDHGPVFNAVVDDLETIRTNMRFLIDELSRQQIETEGGLGVQAESVNSRTAPSIEKIH